MADFDDFQLDKTPSLPERARSRAVPGAIIVVMILALAGGWYYLRHRSALNRSVSVHDERIVAQQGAKPSEAAPADLPPLDESDDLVRELVSALSRHPIVAAWLTTDQLVRTFAVAVMNVAGGDSPSGQLHTIKPGAKFQVRQQGSRTLVDPRSFSRFDGHADAFAGMDPEGAARLYERLKPRIAEAYREVAGAEANVDRGLERAIVELLKTPVVEGDIRLEPRTVGYSYADPALESLSSAQRQLLRMGPRNVRLVQQQLRAIARHLGIDEASLPRERVIRSAG